MSEERARDRGAAKPAQACRTSLVTKRAIRLVAAATVAAVLGGAVPPALSEYQVKAAFLYNFAKFVEWPAEAPSEASAEMVLCLLGDDPFGSDLEQTIEGKMVNGRKLVIRRFKALRGLETCHILFISPSEGNQLLEILAALKGLSLLTVGEMERFTKLGGIINFTIEGNKVRFDINIDAAERAGLKISSRLLRVARVVRDESARQ